MRPSLSSLASSRRLPGTALLVRMLDPFLPFPLIPGITQTIDIVRALLDGAPGEEFLTLLSFVLPKPVVPRPRAASR